MGLWLVNWQKIERRKGGNGKDVDNGFVNSMRFPLFFHEEVLRLMSVFSITYDITRFTIYKDTRLTIP